MLEPVGEDIPMPSSSTSEPTRLLFVCLGNICRSPTAEGVMRELVREAGLERDIELDSAGTGGWHVGSSPDERATGAARARGIVLEGAARQLTKADFEDFDLLLAPDQAARDRARLLREFDPASDPASASAGDLDVPDPYYGGPGGFDDVLDLVHAACVGLLAELRASGPA
jgi:protein-tyrosine phosphatase